MTPATLLQAPKSQRDWGLHIMTVQEVAQRTGYKPVTIYRLASEGRIPSFRVQSFLRFEEKSLLRWMDQQGIQDHKVA